MTIGSLEYGALILPVAGFGSLPGAAGSLYLATEHKAGIGSESVRTE